jgi:uncharacterized surface protein with fasciclin (FAS1) repeats
MKSTSARLAAGIVALALIASGCSDDDGDDGADATTTEAAAEEETTDSMAEEEGAEEPAEAADIVDTAVEAGDFTTLVAAVQAAELEETLRGDGPFTVFAPTDDAFAALPEGTVDTLLEDPSGDLTDILTYHVVEGEVLSSDLSDGQEVTTVNGATFTVNVGDDGAVSLTDAAGNEINVTAADVDASNGVIHVIDGILMPA